VRPDGPGIKADDAVQVEPGGGLEEADPTAEAEPDGVQAFRGSAVGQAQEARRGGHVVVDGGRIQPADVRLVLESLGALLTAGGARVEVDRHRVHAGLGEAQGQLLIVGMQPAHVRDDHDAGAARLLGPRSMRRDGRPVAAGERQVTRVERASADGWEWGSGVGVEAHGCQDRTRRA
jgi:hypothetical protein